MHINNNINYFNNIHQVGMSCEPMDLLFLENSSVSEYAI